MKLNPDFPSAFNFEKTHRPVTVVTHFRVRSVMADDDVIPFGKLNHALEKGLVGDRRRGIVWVIDPKQLRLFGNVWRDRVQVR